MKLRLFFLLHFFYFRNFTEEINMDVIQYSYNLILSFFSYANVSFVEDTKTIKWFMLRNCFKLHFSNGKNENENSLAFQLNLFHIMCVTLCCYM